MSRDDTQAPQTLIYTRQGTITEAWEDGSFIWLIDTLYSAQNLRTMMGNILNVAYFSESGAGAGALTLENKGDSVPIVPSRTGLIIVSLDVDTIISGSLMMCSPYSGQKVTIMTRGAVAANTAGWYLAFSCGTSGGILSDLAVIEDSDVNSLSLVNFLASASQHPWITFISPNGDEWAVLSYGSQSVLLDNDRADDIITIGVES